MKKWPYNKQATFENLHNKTKSQWSDEWQSAAAKTILAAAKTRASQKPLRNILPPSMGLFPLTSAVYLKYDGSEISRPQYKKKSATYPSTRRRQRHLYEQQDSDSKRNFFEQHDSDSNRNFFEQQDSDSNRNFFEQHDSDSNKNSAGRRPSSASVSSCKSQSDGALASVVKSKWHDTNNTIRNNSSPVVLAPTIDTRPSSDQMPSTDPDNKTPKFKFNGGKNNHFNATQKMPEPASSGHRSSLPSTLRTKPQSVDKESSRKSTVEQPPKLTALDMGFSTKPQIVDKEPKRKSPVEQPPELTAEDMEFLPCAQDSPDLGTESHHYLHP